MIRILKPCRTAKLVSARVFDELFVRNLASDFEIDQVPLLSWLDTILGPVASPVSLGQAARNFAAECASFDYLCPNYECIALAPLLLSLRNRAQAKTRLLLIAHAPGAYAIEWALLRPLLMPGDLIIAPSANTRDTIEFLCPELSEFVRVIPHPMHSLPQAENREQGRIVSLGRIHPGKLVHRQVEAMAVLRSRGWRSLKMHVAGPLTDEASNGRSAYACSLAAKIHRLHLEDHVQLVGPIHGDGAKARFISGARLMLNLSVTIEESFGKSPIEALGLGVPVLATHWDGLPETVGEAGELLPVLDVGPGLAVDVAAEQIADAIERIITCPPSPETCRKQARRFHPERIIPKYRAALKEGADLAASHKASAEAFESPMLRAAPEAGLLSLTAPLLPFSWRELFELHVEDAARIRRRFADEFVPGVSNGERLRTLLLVSTQKPLERFLGGLECSSWVAPTGPTEHMPCAEGEFIDRLISASGFRATQTSRQVCLVTALDTGQTERLRAGLALLKQGRRKPTGLGYLGVEAERQSGNFSRAFEHCTAEKDPNLWGEFAAHRLRQLARICREWGRPELALPWLRQWLEQFPDSPDSGMVWLDRCVNASRAGDESLPEASEAFEHARNQLGDLPVLDKVERSLFARMYVEASLSEQ